MRLRLLLPSLALALLWACPSLAAPELLSETHQGTPVKVLSLPQTEFQASFHFPKVGTSITALAALEANPEALAAFNGGYFLPGGKPLGLLIEDSQERNPLRRADWGVFFVDQRGRARILHRRDYAAQNPPPAPVFALECGPRIVVDGKALKLKPSRERRTVLALTGTGKILVAVFPRPVDLAVVAEYLLQRWSVTEALNLDGGSSTQLATRLDQDSPRAQAHGIPVPYTVLLLPPKPQVPQGNGKAKESRP
jgi:uncharacterized protein YigE (DUF2233 family)